MSNQPAKTGFQMLMVQRGAMQNWSHVQTLLSHGRNREAAAIVESFEKQMEFEEFEHRYSQTSNLKVA